MEPTKSARDKRLRRAVKLPPRYAPGRTGTMLRRTLHTDIPLTKSSGAVTLIPDDLGPDQSASGLVQRTKEQPFLPCDCFKAGAILSARSIDLSKSLSRNQLSKTDAPSRSRSIKPARPFPGSGSHREKS